MNKQADVPAAAPENWQPVACACERCRDMCARSTCLPTPAGARELIRQGFGPRLASYRFAPDPQTLAFVGPAPRGQEGARDLMHTMSGACTFFDGERCELHALGLKPLEGQLALHDRPWQAVRLHICSTWKGKQFDSVLAMLERSAP
jgi:hypothetical protein